MPKTEKLVTFHGIKGRLTKKRIRRESKMDRAREADEISSDSMLR